MQSVRPDELEVSIFGPGYGESIAVHLGANHWIIVDSCLDPSSGKIAPLRYLERIGVDPAEAVRLIVATHWHDDHIRGLSDLVSTCSNARFVCASAMNISEFTTMVTRYEEGGPRTAAGSGVREMYRVLRHLHASGRRPEFAAPNRLILRCPEASEVAGGKCEVTSLSPSDSQIEAFWNDIADQMPQIRQTIRRIVPKSPNHLAIVLWVQAGEEVVLLGSDLQETTDEYRGWSVIVESKERPLGVAAVFKVPHHGSQNAHSDAVWDQLIAKGGYALLSPFTNGNVSLPTPLDVARIVAKTNSAYITSDPAGRPPIMRSPAVMRAVRGHRLRMAEPRLGHVRLRKRFAPRGRWYVMLAPGAYKLRAAKAA
jgi:beta-lactamase superfamily II metal-dependent hydrolase